MGQAPIQGVKDSFYTQLALISDHLYRQASELKQTATLSYENFLESIATMNQMTRSFSDINGKHLFFCIKPVTDESIFWKALVKIKCFKINSRNGAIESTRILTLKQYIHLYNEVCLIISNQTNFSLVNQQLNGNNKRNDESREIEEILGEGGEVLYDRNEEGREIDAKAVGDGVRNSSCENKLYPCLIDTSIILNKLEDAKISDEEECVICMERKSQIILPCSHSYCEECINNWFGKQINHQNCPICRAEVTSGMDSWVLSEKPDDHEMAYETTGYLMGLVDQHPPEYDVD